MNITQLLLTTCALSTVLHAQTTFIDSSFDGVANDVNGDFETLSNLQGSRSGATWNQATGFVNRGSENNSTAGAVSTTTIDIATLGTDPDYLDGRFREHHRRSSRQWNFRRLSSRRLAESNAGDNLWNNSAPAFGVVIDGGNRLGSSVVAPGGNSSTGDFQDAPAFGTTTLASLNDGFSVTLTVDNIGWEFALTGLETAAAAPITGGSGVWADLAFDFSDFTSDMRVAFTTQGNGGGSLDLASVTVASGVVPDADMDGMSDAYEMANGTEVNINDADLDEDEDGLSNLQEFLGQNSSDEPTGFGQTLSGTADSDGDTLDDGDEIDGSLNPWTAGTFGSPPGEPTNPNQQDSDEDGSNDDVEIANNTDPNNPPPNTGPLFPFVDSDGDSFSDIAESAFGSSPNDANDIPNHSSSPAQPNIVVIYADDMGLGDMSAYGDLFGTPSPAVTPHMNALATEGTLFTQAHSSNGVCTPSRYALLTGKYNWRLFNGISRHYGWFSNAIPELPLPSDVTIAEFLKTQAYDTAAFGKWHLGGAYFAPGTNTRITGTTTNRGSTNNPTLSTDVDWARPVEDHAVAHGFDTFQGLAASINFGPYVYLENDRNQFWDASLNGGSGAFRNATNSDTMRNFTTAELNSTVVGATDSRPSLGDPTYRQVDAGPFHDHSGGRVHYRPRSES